MKNRIILLGPPATGKGTQAALLSATFGIPAGSTGAMLREEKAQGSSLGQEAASWTDQGKLVPDDLVLKVVWHWLDGRTRFVLDGFPRTVGQAEAFDAGLAERSLPVESVYFLDLSEDVIRQRMGSRLTCSKCSAVYQESFHSLTTDSPCPDCGGKLYRRTDDTNEALEQRLTQYRECTLPVVNYYEKQGKLIRVDASPDRETVFRHLYENIAGEAPSEALIAEVVQ